MGNKAATGSYPALLDSDKYRVKSVGSGVLPEDIARIVGKYLSDSNRNYVETALTGVQPIFLCLSQNLNSQFNSCWSLGLLPPEHLWDSMNVKVGIQFEIKDYEHCLHFLNEKSSFYCRVSIERLVVKLSMSSFFSSYVLVDLKNAIIALQGHLKRVKHVVISIAEQAFCCFSLIDAIDTKIKEHRPLARLGVLLEIIRDLDLCWKKNCTLSVGDVFDFYFKGNTERKSEKYLAKLVILVNHRLCRTLLKKNKVSRVKSKKIMWVYSLASYNDFYEIDQDTLRVCNAVRLHTSKLTIEQEISVENYLEHAFCYQENPFIERIVISSDYHIGDLQLPRPSALPVNAKPFSALVELTLQGDCIILHLTDLNNNYFPHLAHLCVIGGTITGHLDSHCVPRLKTLVLDPGNEDDRSCSDGYLVNERAQSLIHAGRPWQLVATQQRGGWSLASYDEPKINPQLETKDDSPFSHLDSSPIIRELLLVASLQEHANEWESQLEGGPPLEALAEDHNDRLLMWAPESVHKITMFYNGLRSKPWLDFRKTLPGHTRTLTSLTCHRISIALDGATLPHLQSLEVNHSWVKLLGTFSNMLTLSFHEAGVHSPYQLNAPLLQSFNCCYLKDGANLSVRPQLLPHLSFLSIALSKMNFLLHPKILIDQGDNIGLSRVNHVVFGEGMTPSFYFNECQVHCVRHLELRVDPFQLPLCWSNTVWRCEILVLDIHPFSRKHSHKPDRPDIVVLPPLPHVKTLKVTEKYCQVLLNSKMPQLTKCTVASLRSFGSKLKCPALQRIHFTAKLSKSHKMQCLDPRTYEMISGQPREIFFDFTGEVHSISWDITIKANGASPSDGP